MSEPPFQPPSRSWKAKFRAALAAMGRAWVSQSSFHVHGVFAVLVVLAGWLLRVGRVEWCLLLLCVTLVLAAEMFNTALEILARAVDRQFNPHLKEALDVASGGVLTTALGAALVGAVIFLSRVAQLTGWLGP